MNRKKKPPHPGLAGALLGWTAAFIVRVRREAAVTLLLLAGLAAAYGIYRTVQTDPEPEAVDLRACPLTSERLDRWSEAVSELAARRARGMIRLEADRLPSFIDWARTKPDLLDAVLRGGSREEFLGVTLGIHEARKNLVRLLEFDRRAVLEAGAYSQEDLARLEVSPLEPPALTPLERNNLALYESRFEGVESALFGLLPALDDPFYPAAETAGPAPEGEGAQAPPRRIAWRSVNASRYGPRVLKER